MTIGGILSTQKYKLRRQEICQLLYKNRVLSYLMVMVDLMAYLRVVNPEVGIPADVNNDTLEKFYFSSN